MNRRYCRHTNAAPRTLNHAKRVAYLACGDCGRRVERAIVACPDCNHIPFTQRGDCATCPAEIRGWVLAAVPESPDCCYREDVRSGEVEPCANCGRMMAAGSRHLIHGCDRRTPDDEEYADDLASAPPMPRLGTSQAARERSAAMEV